MKKYSKKWISTFVDGELPENKKIIEEMSKKAFEVESVEETGEDSLFEIKVLPNRVPDAMSLEGMAKEFCTVFDLKPKVWKAGMSLDGLKENNDFVKVDETAVLAFYGLKVKIQKQIETPDWIKDVLVKCGGRPINSLVDITNLILFTLGQPAHVFDAKKMKGGLTARYAKAGEELVLLDGKKVVMKESDFVIADDERALSLAGIKGGKFAEVDKDTTEGIFEMANFSPVMIRKSSQSLGIRTDASKLFENGVSTEKTKEALSVLVATIRDIYKDAEIEYIFQKEVVSNTSKPVILNLQHVNNYAGKILEKKEIEDILRRLDFGFEDKGENTLQVTPSSNRLDINIEEDCIEEILRVYGFDNIPSAPLKLNNKIVHDTSFLIENSIRSTLISAGFTEVMSYSFKDTGSVKVIMAIASDKEYLRESLSKSLSETFTKNYNFLPVLETDKLKFFEIGSVFYYEGSVIKEDKRIMIVLDDNKKKTKYLEEVQALVKRIEEKLGLSIEIIEKSEKPASVEFSLTKLTESADSKGVQIPFEIFTKDLQSINYKKISVYPFIVRDVAVWVPEDFSEDKFLKNIEDLNLSNFSKTYMFDSFEKDGRRSIAFRIIFQSYERTLTDAEIEEEMKKVNSFLKESLFEIR
jgi:phenylalanyl-tRNA synthetase beta chain